MNQQLIQMLFSEKQLQRRMTFKQALSCLWDQHLLNTGEMAERALVKKSKGQLKQNTRNKKASDFSDHSENKYATVRYESDQHCGRASISGLNNKIGLLRVIVYEPKTQTNYFFRVPHRVYKNVRSPKIYFDQKGQPKSPTRKGSKFDMWNYKCTAKQWAAK